MNKRVNTSLCQVHQPNSTHQQSHSQFKDYMCSRGTGEKLGFRRQQNDLDKLCSVNLNSFFVNTTYTPKPDLYTSVLTKWKVWFCGRAKRSVANPISSYLIISYRTSVCVVPVPKTVQAIFYMRFSGKLVQVSGI